MRQRVVIALALAPEPSLIIADEPTTALDVSVQAQILDLLKKLCKERGTSIILVTHDMGVIAETVMVMYLGYIVEIGTTDEVFSPPYQPYTEALLSAVPIADTQVIKEHIVLEGDVPSAINPPTGCPFQNSMQMERKSWERFV